MKRIISALLVIVMLAAMITVPTVTASAWSAPSSYTNTTQLYNTDLPTRYAVKGTPTIDGDKSEWANAYTYRVDRSQNALLGGSTPLGTMADVYMMWDENYLYILEERFYETIIRTEADVTDKTIYYNFGKQGSAHYVVLPSDYTDDTTTTNNGGTAMIYTVPGLVSAENKTLDSYINGRIKWFTNNTQSTSQAVITPGTVSGQTYTAFGADDQATWTGATSKTTLTETGYFMETAIPWNFLDQRCSEAFTPAANTIIGIGLNVSRGGTNANIIGNMKDENGFQQLKLIEVGEGKTYETNPTVKPVIADISWYDKSQTEFTITTAEQLLGLCELTHLHNDYAQWYKNNSKIGTADYKVVTRGKTFKLGNDITLNVGTTFNADGTYTGNAPMNGWSGIGGLSGGTFDGCGYTVYGLYGPYGLPVGSKADDFGFVGRLSVGSTIKNLSLKNGYLKAGNTSENIGSFAGIISGSDGDGTAIVMSNLYSNLTIVGSTSAEKTGGIAGTAYTGGSGHTYYVEDVVYEGVVTGNAPGWFASRSWTGTSFKATIKDCTSNSTLPMFANNPKDITDLSNPTAYIQKTEIVDGTFAVRILGLIDEEELALDNVGMKVTVVATYGDGETEERTYSNSMTTTTVYKSVNAAGVDVAISELHYDYAYGVVIEKLPAAAGDKVVITVQLTQNGADYGNPYTATYEQPAAEQ